MFPFLFDVSKYKKESQDSYNSYNSSNATISDETMQSNSCILNHFSTFAASYSVMEKTGWLVLGGKMPFLYTNTAGFFCKSISNKLLCFFF